MNRNVESHFALNPTWVDLPRSRFDMSHNVKMTLNSSYLVPFSVMEVLPGDTFKVTTSKVIRLQTLLAPIMDNMYLDTYWFFVPNRLVWDHWREFMGENTQSAWLDPVEYSVPTLYVEGGNTVSVGSLADYMGIPVGKSYMRWNALPFRAFWKVYQDWFRDENLIDPVNLYTGDASREYGVETPVHTDVDPNLPHVSKYHDYFSSALPQAQRGPAVTVPTSGMAPVFTSDREHESIPTTLKPMTGAMVPVAGGDSSQSDWYLWRDSSDSGRVHATGSAGISSSGVAFSPNNLWANLEGVSEVTINNLRLAFQIQKMYEKDARGGSRYIEILKAHFGVTSPDARLQRPEYLGGNRIPLNVHQIANTAQGEQDFLGDLGAMSHTVDVHGDFVHSFTEHGFVLGVMCVRYDHTYGQGLEKFWSRRSRFDFYWPVFANIGEQPILNKEIYVDGKDTSESENEEVFGYQEAWADYRYKPNRVAGEMRTDVQNSLASWHLADNYTSTPRLSADWIQETETNVDRVLAVTSSVADQILADIYVKCEATRPMPLYSIPGLIDHH